MLIVLEGIDGCGKTTQCDRLETALRARGDDVLRLREPGGTVLGEQIRTLLLDRSTRACPAAELFGYQMARAQLCDEVIRPALTAKRTVLLDRFYHSTIAYQAFGLGLDEAQVRAVITLATGGLRPDVALWYDLPVTDAFRRRSTARGVEDRIEARGLAYLEKVRAGYQAQADRGELIRIDAQQNIDVVFAETKHHAGLIR